MTPSTALLTPLPPYRLSPSRSSNASKGPVVEDDLDLDRWVAAGVEDLARPDELNTGHECRLSDVAPTGRSPDPGAQRYCRQPIGAPTSSAADPTERPQIQAR